MIIEIYPEFDAGHEGYGIALAEKGLYKQGISACEKSTRRKVICLGYVHAKSGNRVEGKRLLGQIVVDSIQFELFRISLHSILGNKEKAISGLEQIFESKNHNVTRIVSDPAFANLKEEPRYKALLKRMGIPVVEK